MNIEIYCVDPKCNYEQETEDLNKYLRHITHNHCTFCGVWVPENNYYNTLDNYNPSGNKISRILNSVRQQVTGKAGLKKLEKHKGGIIHPLIEKFEENQHQYVNLEDSEYTVNEIVGDKPINFKRHVGSVCEDCKEEYDVIVNDANSVPGM